MNFINDDQPGGYLVPENMRLRIEHPDAWNSGFDSGVNAGRRAERERLRYELMGALALAASAVITVALAVTAFLF